MGQKSIENNELLAKAIKARRLELGMTIENAASKAGVGTKTWCRYEAGEAIRSDKVRGICRALNWTSLQYVADEEVDIWGLDEYKKHEFWSNKICERHGEIAAISFVVGSDILIDLLNDDMNELSRMPKGTHLGELDFSNISFLLPEQFLTRYDYEFMYLLKSTIRKMRLQARANNLLNAHSVIEELALYLMVEEAEFLIECDREKLEEDGVEIDNDWKEWIFDFFDDMDIVTWLYSGVYVDENCNYHFNYWADEQFYIQ